MMNFETLRKADVKNAPFTYLTTANVKAQNDGHIHNDSLSKISTCLINQEALDRKEKRGGLQMRLKSFLERKHSTA